MGRCSRLALLFAAALCLMTGAVSAQVAPVPADAWAWSSNAGWIDLRPDATDGVRADATHLEGWAWAPNLGWVGFGDGSPASGGAYSNTSAGDHGVNRDAEGWLSGYAWAPNAGWIRLDWAAPGTPGLPRWDPATGRITGSAWSANVGWVALGAQDLFEIAIPDLALRGALLAALGRESGAITNVDLATLTTLELSGLGIADLTGLRHAVSLQSIDLSGNRLRSVQELVPITGLQVVDVSRNRIADLSPLRHVAIRELRAADNAVRSLAGFEEMLLLEVLDLAGNAVRDLAPLAALPALRELDVSRNKLASLEPLANVQALRVLDARRNAVDDITALALGDNAKRLLVLDVRENLVDLAPAFGQEDLLLTRFVAAQPGDVRWLPQLVPPVAAGSGLASSLEPGVAAPTTGSAVAADDRFLVTAGTLARGDGLRTPVVYVHERDGAGWRQVATLRPAGDVAILDDTFRVGILDDTFRGEGVAARVALGGALVVDGGAPRPGVLVFALAASGWVFETTLLHGGEVGILDDASRAGILDDTFRTGAVPASERIGLLRGGTVGILDDTFRLASGDGRIVLGGLALAADSPYVGARAVTFAFGAGGWSELPLLDPLAEAGILDDTFRGATGFDLAGVGERLWVVAVVRGREGGGTARLLGFGPEPVGGVTKGRSLTTFSEPRWFGFEDLLVGGDLDLADIVMQVFVEPEQEGGGPPVETVVLAGVPPDEDGDGESTPVVFILKDSGFGLAEIAVLQPTFAAELSGRWGDLSVAIDPATGRVVLGARILDASGEPTAGLVVFAPGETTWATGPSVVLPAAGGSLGIGLGGGAVLVGGAPTDLLAAGTTTLVPLALVTGAEEPIRFADPALEAVVRAAIERPTGPLFAEDVEGLAELHARRAGIANLSGIEHLTGLASLWIAGNAVRSIEPLRFLAGLQVLELYGNPVEDFAALSDPRLAGIVHLDVRETSFADLALLAGLSAPRNLLVGDAALLDFGAFATLENLRSLKELNLVGSPIASLGPLVPLVALENLVLSETTLAPSAWELLATPGHWPALRSLYVDYSTFDDLRVLQGRPLSFLEASGCNLASLEPLRDPGLNGISHLYLSLVRVPDHSPIRSMPALVSLSLFRCGIEDFGFLEGMSSLRYLSLAQNDASGLGPVAGLVDLDQLDVRENFLDLAPGSPASTAIAALVAAGVQVQSSPQRVEAHVPDPALYAAIRYYLGKPTGRIAVEDLSLLTQLAAFGVGDLTGLEHAAQLRLLQVAHGSVVSLAPLAGLDRLRFLFLRDNAIADLAPLAPLEGLDTLDVSDNAITDLAPLGAKPVLRILLAARNAIPSVAPLSEYRGLVQLDLDGNLLTTLAGLGTKPELRILDIDRNAVTSLAGLSGSLGLRELTAVGNRISDLSPLAAMAELDSVVVDDNLLATLFPLRGLAKLRYVYATLNLLDLAPASDDSADIAAIRALPLAPLVLVDPQRTGEADLDGDGLPDGFEQVIADANPTDAITGPADVRPGDDFDGDGQSNGFEFIAGTGPTDPLSRLMIQSFEDGPAAGEATVVVMVGQGRQFRIEVAVSPAGPWSDSGLGWTVAEGAIVERVFPLPALSTAARRFWRVEARIASP